MPFDASTNTTYDASEYSVSIIESAECHPVLPNMFLPVVAPLILAED